MRYFLALWRLCLALPAQAQTPAPQPIKASIAISLASEMVTGFAPSVPNGENSGASHSLRWPSLLLLAGESADLLSTEYVLRTTPNVAEGNPLFQTTTRRIVGKVAMTSLILWGMRYEAQHGHPTAAKWLGFSIGSFVAACAISNLSMQ